MKRHRIYSVALLGLGTAIGYSCYSQAQQAIAPSGAVAKTEIQATPGGLVPVTTLVGQIGASAGPIMPNAPVPAVQPTPPVAGSFNRSLIAPSVAQPNKDWVAFRDGKFVVIHSDDGMNGDAIKEQQESSKKLEEILKVIRSDKSSSEALADAKKKIAQYLKLYFETDLERRRKQIESMEEQIDKLKKQVAKRAASMDELIDLRLKILENDSQGLGFPQAWNMPNLSATDSSSNTNAWPHSFSPSFLYSDNYGQGYTVPNASIAYPAAPSAGSLPMTPMPPAEASKRPAKDREPRGRSPADPL